MWHKSCHTRSVDPRAERSRAKALQAAQTLLLSEGIDAITHARVAEVSGVGRRTLYRHWPDQRSLVHATLSLIRAPDADPTVDLRAGLVAHLTALSSALTSGPLGYVVATLYERSVHDPAFESLRSELVRSGCAPLESMLERAAAGGDLPSDLDVDSAVAALEGPVFHRAMLHRRPTDRVRVEELVGRFLESPPRSGGRPAR